MSIIINLTQHTPTAEQSAVGVVEPSPEIKSQVKALLLFKNLPDRKEIEQRADELAAIAVDYESAMIGGAPFLMGALQKALKEKGVQPLCSFSQRVSVEKKMEDGSVVKTNVFRHLGFVEV